MTSADDPDSPTTAASPGTVSVEGRPRAPSAPAVGARAPMASSALDSETVPSAPQITRADLAFNERLAQCEQQLQDLRSLVERLERSPSEVTPTPTVPRWFWLLFLATLALAWQIFAHFR